MSVALVVVRHVVRPGSEVRAVGANPSAEIMKSLPCPGTTPSTYVRRNDEVAREGVRDSLASRPWRRPIRSVFVMPPRCCDTATCDPSRRTTSSRELPLTEPKCVDCSCRPSLVKRFLGRIVAISGFTRVRESRRRGPGGHEFRRAERPRRARPADPRSRQSARCGILGRGRALRKALRLEVVTTEAVTGTVWRCLPPTLTIDQRADLERRARTPRTAVTRWSARTLTARGRVQCVSAYAQERRARDRDTSLRSVTGKPGGPTAMTVKMRDIAKDLGVSVITVSKVLRNHPEVGHDTRERVLARVKELDYRPNLAARSLVTGRTYLVGLIVPDLLHPFFAEIAKSLSDVLRKSGYYLIIASSEEDPDLEQQEVDQLLARQLDILIIASCRPTAELVVRIERHKTPYILIDRTYPWCLRELCRRRRCCRRPARHRTFDRDRMQTDRAHPRAGDQSWSRPVGGIQTGAGAPGITIKERYITSVRKVDVDSKQRGAEAMAQLLHLKPKPDGVFCYNDPLATGAMDYAIEHGARIPEDVAIIGCGNLHYDDSLRVGLSSIDQHSRRIGEAAARIALGILGSRVPPAPETVILQPELVIRASTRRKAHRRGR